MVLYKDGKVYLKIVYWGMGGSGKTTILKTLYRITKETKKEIVPIGELQIIEKDDGATLYFDRGLFQSTKHQKVYYRVYTVAGRKGFTPLRKKIFDKTEDQTDAVILVVDSQTKFLEDNVESLLELKNMARNRLIKEIPMIVMLNKQDLDDVIDVDDIIHLLKREKLWYEPNEKLSLWNPPIYKTCALFENQKGIYHSFQECTRMCLDKPPQPPDDVKPAVQTQRKIPKEKEEPPLKATEIENLECDKVKKLKKQYEEETSKYAIWRGTITESFKKWLKGEKVYDHLSPYKDIPIVKDIIISKDSHYDILLIDDDLSTLRLLTTYFKSKGVTCKAVTRGTQGLEELENNHPKVVLLDIILPDIDGFEICKKIKSNQKLKNIPVFFMSSIPSSEVEKHLAETKADGYILHPFNFSDFDGILDLLGTR
jgi:CheY-like chemotaxis protein/GTPase SAR1 family protein